MDRRTFIAVAASVALTACSSIGGGEYGYSDYAPVNVRRVSVGDGTMSVIPPRPWNRRRDVLFDDVRAVELWTLNGPLLDGITFISGRRPTSTERRGR